MESTKPDNLEQNRKPDKIFPVKVMGHHLDHFILRLLAPKTIGSVCYRSKLRKIRQIKENETN